MYWSQAVPAERQEEIYGSILTTLSPVSFIDFLDTGKVNFASFEMLEARPLHTVEFKKKTISKLAVVENLCLNADVWTGKNRAFLGVLLRIGLINL